MLSGIAFVSRNGLRLCAAPTLIYKVAGNISNGLVAITFWTLGRARTDKGKAGKRVEPEVMIQRRDKTGPIANGLAATGNKD